jgi:hypothetical protein
MRIPRPVPDLLLPRAAPIDGARRIAEGVAGTLRMASALAAAGRRVDLAGLEGPIGLLCAKSLDLPPHEGRRMRGALIALLQEVDALAAMLESGRSGGTA